MNTLQKIFFFILISCLLLTAYCSLSQASLSSQEEQDAFNLSSNAIGKDVGEYTLIDQDGKRFKLKEFAGGKPFIISLIYTSCGHICPAITMNFKNAVKEASKDFGVKFNAITVGFDVENDTPDRMKEYGKNFTESFQNWKFAASDKDTIEKLARDLGFYYKKIQGGFDHLNVVTIVDAKGKVYQHVYGVEFKPEAILRPVYEVWMGKSYYRKSSGFEEAGIIDRIILFCYKYDEKSGQYKLDYPFLIGTALEAIVIFSAIFFVWGRNIKSFFTRQFGHGIDVKVK
ncbi:MAG: SCO family protein [Deltaproteobacteria bacterium]|nr:SCO family protein [Deltaproteobacteria bacterium]